MGKRTGIEWTEHTWNPWVGCRKISPGCKCCYMYREQRRYKQDPEQIRRTTDATFYTPLKWAEPSMVFTCSWSDFFLPEADPWRHDAWEVTRRTPHLTYQILTKRVAEIPGRLPAGWGAGWPNVWLRVSVEQCDYLWRIAKLVEIPARVRFVSYEPALGPVDLTPYLPQLQWVISGGESDDETPRPSDPAWFCAVRDQCARAGVAYFHKQNGGTRKIDGSWGGHLLEGRVHRSFPRVDSSALVGDTPTPWDA